jgi:polyisoprenoid-binding protein YceI
MKIILFISFLSFSFTKLYAQEVKVNSKEAVINFNYLSEETKGTFSNVTALISLDTENLNSSSISGEAEVATINTGNVARDKHLKSKTYFNVTAFPKITFKSKSIVKIEEHYEASGTVNIKGFNKPVTFIIEIIDHTIVLKTSIYADDFGVAIKKGRELSLVELEIILPFN